MPIETLDDITEEIADRLGVYGKLRSEFVIDLMSRIRDAIAIEAVMAAEREG